MPRFCAHCGHDITCSSCAGRGFSLELPDSDARDTGLPRCNSCFGDGLFESHACADVFDEFRDAQEASLIPEMLTHPDVELPSRRHVVIRTLPTAYIREDAKMRPVFAHIPVVRGQSYRSLLDGFTECPEHLGDVVYLLVLASVALILRAEAERTLTLRLAGAWDSEFARIRLDVEETLHRRASVVLFRRFIGRVF